MIDLSGNYHPKDKSSFKTPSHLTVVGQFIWWHVPRWGTHGDIRSGEVFRGLKSKAGTQWAGLLVDFYHGYWPRSRGVPYWRKSFCIRHVFSWQWRVAGKAYRYDVPRQDLTNYG